MKTTLTVITASLTILFAACETSTNTTTTPNTANKSNTTVVVNSNQTSVANIATNTTNTAANTATKAVSSNDKAAPMKDGGKIEGEYVVGDVKCTITPDGRDTNLYYKVKFADNPKAEDYSRDDDPKAKKAILASGKGRFVFENYPSNTASGTFTDEKGKTVKVTRAQ